MWNDITTFTPLHPSIQLHISFFHKILKTSSTTSRLWWGRETLSLYIFLSSSFFFRFNIIFLFMVFNFYFSLHKSVEPDLLRGNYAGFCVFRWCNGVVHLFLELSVTKKSSILELRKKNAFKNYMKWIHSSLINGKLWMEKV